MATLIPSLNKSDKMSQVKAWQLNFLVRKCVVIINNKLLIIN